jgi:hypothetical protein
MSSGKIANGLRVTPSRGLHFHALLDLIGARLKSRDALRGRKCAIIEEMLPHVISEAQPVFRTGEQGPGAYSADSHS